MAIQPGHIVAIMGGAVSGSEAAYQLAQRGIRSVVFEQKALPYGKIEDGLPKWHVKLRDKEEQKIDEKLDHPLISFVPNTRLGADIELRDLIDNWGFSAVLLANGAWRDRSLPVPGIDYYINRGLVYQNPLVMWFNHNHEPDYDGPTYDLPDNAVIIGGGLASIDVAKIVMLETVHAALQAKGHNVDLLTLERKGIAAILATYNLTLTDLGLQGCTLYYRRRAVDMPLVSLPPDAKHEQNIKAMPIREKILNNAREKYLFRFQECQTPIEKIIENDRLAGLVFQETRVVDGVLQKVADSQTTVRTPLVISSIGSVPEAIEGIQNQGEAYRISNKDTGKVEGYDNVFVLGNAVTGRGNIKESLKHGRLVAGHVADEYLTQLDAPFEALFEGVADDAQERVQRLFDVIRDKKLLTPGEIKDILNRVEARQNAVGFDGNYEQWVIKHLPPRLEDILKQS